ncbi:MAG: inverse autotransporter beta domain-containing protein [Legionellales bacterium]|nr:inverse autotransporter beta domain-containing protein [Legionellales bacterium]
MIFSAIRIKNILKISALFCVFLSFTGISFSAEQAEVDGNQIQDIRYSPRVELAGKLGYSSKKEQRRDLARLGFVLPVYQKPNAVTFVSLIGVKDNAKHAEGNLGVGHRVLIDGQWIVGGYGFYDLRRTQNAKLLHQATFGIEALSKYL